MLKVLKIKNVALIKDLELRFENGLNVLTGETGAGKSIIIDSLSFLLGSKADKGLIRYGETSAKVEGLFEVENIKEIKDFFDKYSFDFDNTIIISRVMSADNKNECRVNGELITVSLLKELTSLLVNIHGQNEHQRILNEKYQLQILDEFIGEDIFKQKNLYLEQYEKLQNINSNIREIGIDDEGRIREIELLNFQIDEITKNDIVEGEEEKLRQERKGIQNIEKITNNLTLCRDILSSEFSGNVISNVKTAKSLLASITEYNQEISDCFNRLESVKIELDDINGTIDNIIDSEQFDENRLNEIEKRLDLINSAKLKYGSTVEVINRYLSTCIARRDYLLNSAETLKKLKMDRKIVLEKLYNLSQKIREYRVSYSKTLCKFITKNLQDLNMNAELYFDFNAFPSLEEFENKICKSGVDSAIIMLSANIGHKSQPLSKIISGGEMSRFMLAFKCVILQHNNSQTVIFDEVDTGISGITAQSVANKMALISKNEQVIVISHLFQIGAMADHHYLINKYVLDNNTYTNVKLLDKEESIRELLKMVSGEEDNSNSNLHIEDILTKNELYKKSLN